VTVKHFAAFGRRTEHATGGPSAAAHARRPLTLVDTLVACTVAEALQVFWIALYGVARSFVGPGRFSGADLGWAALWSGTVILLIGFVAGRTGSPRGVRIGVVCGVALVVMAIAIPIANPWFGTVFPDGFLLALPGLFLLATTLVTRGFLWDRRGRHRTDDPGGLAAVRDDASLTSAPRWTGRTTIDGGESRT
jgi:hypothetical protein